jgi:hypothetical protein
MFGRHLARAVLKSPRRIGQDRLEFPRQSWQAIQFQRRHPQVFGERSPRGCGMGTLYHAARTGAMPARRNNGRGACLDLLCLDLPIMPA